MSGYSSVFWLALCASLTALGLVLTVVVGRRRSVRATLHGAAWSLIPIAAYMTGSTLMLWRIGVAIGKFASSFVFDPLRWAGIAVVGLIIVLFLASGGRQRRKAARAGRAARRAKAEAGGPASPGVGGAVTSGVKGAVTAGTVTASSAPGAADSTVPLGRQAEPEPARRRKAGRGSDNKAPAGKSTPVDNDMADIEEILRKRGILPQAQGWCAEAVIAPQCTAPRFIQV